MTSLAHDHHAPFTIVVSRGSLATDTATTFVWGDGQTRVDGPFTGLHVTHLALGGCVLNDVYREAVPRGIVIDGVRVSVRGAFDAASCSLTPVEYVLEIASQAPRDQVDELADHVESIAEIPTALGSSVTVTRVRA